MSYSSVNQKVEDFDLVELGNSDDDTEIGDDEVLDTSTVYLNAPRSKWSKAWYGIAALLLVLLSTVIGLQIKSMLTSEQGSNKDMAVMREYDRFPGDRGNCTLDSICTPYHSEEELRVGYGDIKDDMDSVDGLLPDIHSNCWYSLNGTDSEPVLKCWPGLYLSGFPKCGTTDMFALLFLDDHIYPSERGWKTGKFRRAEENGTFSYQKEPHWWTRQQYSHWRVPYEDSWMAHAETLANNSDVVAIDASTSTVWERGKANKRNELALIAETLSWLTPKFKMIVMIREPIDRVKSCFRYFLKNTRQSLITAEYFDFMVTERIHNWDNCINVQGYHSFQCIYTLQPSEDGLPLDPTYPVNVKKTRVLISLYAVQLEIWHRYISANNILVVKTEEFHDDRYLVRDVVWDFIGLTRYDGNINETDSEELNNDDNVVDFEIWAETRDLLEGFFAPFNDELTRMLQQPSEYAQTVQPHVNYNEGYTSLIQ